MTQNNTFQANKNISKTIQSLQNLPNNRHKVFFFSDNEIYSPNNADGDQKNSNNKILQTKTLTTALL